MEPGRRREVQVGDQVEEEGGAGTKIVVRAPGDEDSWDGDGRYEGGVKVPAVGVEEGRGR